MDSDELADRSFPRAVDVIVTYDDGSNHRTERYDLADRRKPNHASVHSVCTGDKKIAVIKLAIQEIDCTDTMMIRLA